MRISLKTCEISRRPPYKSASELRQDAVIEHKILFSLLYAQPVYLEYDFETTILHLANVIAYGE